MGLKRITADVMERLKIMSRTSETFLHRFTYRSYLPRTLLLHICACLFHSITIIQIVRQIQIASAISSAVIDMISTESGFFFFADTRTRENVEINVEHGEIFVRGCREILPFHKCTNSAPTPGDKAVTYFNFAS